MIRNFERVVIYTAYIAFILTALVLFAAKAGAWELKHDYKVPLTKVCRDCLASFAQCMDDVDKFNDQREEVDPKDYIDEKQACINVAAKCTEDNKCGTKVVHDKTP